MAEYRQWVISYHGRSNLLKILVNLNSNRCVREVLQCYPKSFPFFKASLELSFSWIMHADMLQRLFGISVQPNACNFFLGLLITQVCRLLSTSGIWLVCVLLMIHMSSFKRRTLGAHKSNMDFLSHRDNQKLFDSMPDPIEAFTAVRGIYTKY